MQRHELDVIQQTNGKIGLIIGLGDDLTASRRMSREEAKKLGQELCRAAGSSPPEDSKHHHKEREESKLTANRITSEIINEDMNGRPTIDKNGNAILFQTKEEIMADKLRSDE